MAAKTTEIPVRTHSRTCLVDITEKVQKVVAASGVSEGVCTLFVLHTTAGVTINENADPDVGTDLLAGLERIVPLRGGYRHGEGNSDAHIKSTLVGCSAVIPVSSGRLRLGTWQGVYFCEFDGPRSRRALVTVR